MTIQTIRPAKIYGTVKAPASKSMMQRAIAIATLSEGTSVLRGYSSSRDSDAALNISNDLGAIVTKDEKSITIKGKLNPRTDTLNCGESGLGIRMFTPIASLWKSPLRLNGDGSLTKRPLDMVEQPLRELGVSVFTNNGFVPIQVCGPLKGGVTNIDGSVSSQFLTGLLIACPLAMNDTTIFVRDLKSKPYIDMTLQILKDFGINISNKNYEEFFIPTQQTYKPRDYTVEGDWSGAAFLMVAGALGGSVTVENIQTDSKQADKEILKALENAGARVLCEMNSVTVTKNELKAFKFDATECPDLFPPLVALAANCNGVSEIKGVTRLKHKESDRATVLQSEFAKLGTVIENKNDTMYIHGGKISGGRINSNNDHRIAMAGAVAAILSDEPVEIENPECVEKSYPEFFRDFEKICIR